MFSRWFASTQLIFSLKQAFILPDSFFTFTFSSLPAPERSTHDPLSSVLLNQQLKVPVTVFTVLKRIWPVSNATWKDFLRWLRLMSRLSVICLLFHIIDLAEFIECGGMCYTAQQPHPQLGREHSYCTFSFTFVEDHIFWTFDWNDTVTAICFSHRLFITHFYFFIVSLPGVECDCKWQMEMFGMWSFCAGCYIKPSLYTKTTRH